MGICQFNYSLEIENEFYGKGKHRKAMHMPEKDFDGVNHCTLNISTRKLRLKSSHSDRSSVPYVYKPRRF